MLKKNRKSIVLLTVIAVFMFGFTFALVPLYNVFCTVTGLNGKIDIQKKTALSLYKTETHPDNKALHPVMVELDINRHQTTAIEFKTEKPVLAVIPGELTETHYTLKNLTEKIVTLQAIPSVSPGYLAKHLKKLECFCFEQQTLEPFESRRLPLRFWLTSDIPSDIHRLTLSYTVFDITSKTERIP